MSPIHPIVASLMVVHQFVNSSNLGCWLVYSTQEIDLQQRSFLSFGSIVGSIVGLTIFFEGLWRNIMAENTLFNLRRGAAKRKAKSEGKAQVTYDKVYVIPPAEGYFQNILFPHYVWEWIEWAGYWMLGGTWGHGLGYRSAALWFLLVEVSTMLPRAVAGRSWYEQKFGKRAVGGRAAAFPGLL
jgi:3-oxo-5-alpha-steroid 4-dehydrogenase 1